MLWGRETRHVPTDLGTWVTPAWLDVDLLLLDLYREWEAGLCPGCGEHISTHDGSRTYESRVIECPAVAALERAQVAQARRDGNKSAKENPDRARQWLFGTREQMREYTRFVRDLMRGGGDG